MDVLGINLGLLLVQSIIPVILFVFPMISLIDLARKKLTGIPLAIWVLVICAVPILGASAYWIVKPTAEGKA
jgi:antibiotic biosynthesis monooxygenase (ABM) superfamily enzyme